MCKNAVIVGLVWDEKQIQLFMFGSFFVAMGMRTAFLLFHCIYLLLSVAEHLQLRQKKSLFSFLSSDYFAPKSGYQSENHPSLRLGNILYFFKKKYLSLFLLSDRETQLCLKLADF